jgi:demethylmenaquinone methyltransferase/2-methoxy-6-polyprenyl-1,4-benzoquinol methylase
VSPPRSAELPEGEEKVRSVRAMFDTIAPRYDVVNRLMTFGLDRSWRRSTVAALRLGPGAPVVDVACGTGDLCRELAAAGYRPVGVDLSMGMLRHARTSAPLVHADALRLPLRDGSLAGAVSGFALRNVADRPTLFAELARVVRPGGRVSLLEVCTPEGRLMRAGHRIWFEHAVPVIGRTLSDADAYHYLPRSVAYLPPGGGLADELTGAGFALAERRLLGGGVTQLITATRSSR